VAGPFGFGWQFLGAFYSKMARNVVDYGPLHARFAMIENALPTTPDHWVVYTHHPPGMALATAVLPAGAYFSTHRSELGPEAIALALLALLLDERARERAGAAAPGGGRSWRSSVRSSSRGRA